VGPKALKNLVAAALLPFSAAEWAIFAFVSGSHLL